MNGMVVNECMTKEVRSIDEHVPASEAASTMVATKISCLVVRRNGADWNYQ